MQCGLLTITISQIKNASMVLVKYNFIKKNAVIALKLEAHKLKVRTKTSLELTWKSHIMKHEQLICWVFYPPRNIYILC